jgi:ribosomal protein S27E
MHTTIDILLKFLAAFVGAAAMVGLLLWAIRPIRVKKAKQEPLRYDRFVNWANPGKCPDCGDDEFHYGPRGGACQNVQCHGCGNKFNICMMPGIAIIHRI